MGAGGGGGGDYHTKKHWRRTSSKGGKEKVPEKCPGVAGDNSTRLDNP